MSRSNLLVSVASMTLLLTIIVRGNEQAQHAQQAPRAEQAEPPSAYLGSSSCERCHQADYANWKNSLHIKMTKPIAEATVLGDFREGTKFADHDRAYQFGMKDGKPWISVAFGARAPETFTVEYTLGSKRYQGYLAK